MIDDKMRLLTPGKWYTIFDESGNCIEAVYDKSYRELLGFETEEEYANAQGSWTSAIHPDDQERLEAAIADGVSKHPEGKDFDIEYRMMTKWGYRWFHDYAHCTRREDGSLIRCDGAVFDIQDLKDFEQQQAHDNLKNEVLDYIVNHDDDPIELLSHFAEKIRVVLNCDQVIYRDLEKTRIMVNSPAIEETWSVPFEYCQQCEHLDAHHPMYAGGYTEMDNCQEGWQGIPVYHKCPIKSSLTRLVYCNEEIAGYLAIHYVQKYHHFTDLERKTVEEFTRNLSLILSRYEAAKEIRSLQERQLAQTQQLIQNNQRVMALEDNFESLYDVELESGKYQGYVKGDFYQSNVADKLLPPGDYFEDLRGNIDAVIYPEDRDALFNILNREALRKALSETDRVEHYYRMYVGDAPLWFKIRVVYKDSDKKSVIIGCFNAEEEMAEKLQNEQIALRNQEIINTFSKQFTAAYIGNLKDGSYKILVRKDAVLQIITGTDTICDAFKTFAEQTVHPADIDLFRKDLYSLKSLRAKFPVGESSSFDYRSNNYGEYRWFRAEFKRINEDDILVGFRDCDEEVVARQVSDKLLNEYDAIYIVYLDKNQIRAALPSRVSSVGSFEGTYPYDQMLRKFAETVAPEFKQNWLNFSDVKYMRAYMSKEDHREFVYELPGIQRTMRRFSIDVLERTDGEAMVLLFSFVGMSDSSAKAILLQREIAERSAFMNYFLGTYVSAYYINLYTLSCQVYKRTDELENDYPIITNYFDSLKEYIDKDVYPDDRESLMKVAEPEQMRAILKEKAEYTHIYRDISGGKEKIYRMQVIRGADEEHAAFGFKDITEEVEAQRAQQRQLEEALTMAQSASRAKTTFLNNMSHDIRTPMNAIIGYTGLAASHLDNKERVQDYLTKIGQSSDHLLSLINDVLDMSRIESGKMNLDEKEEYLPDIIHTLRDIISSDIRSKQHDLFIDTVNVHDEHIVCDKLRLNQVLLNILSNAIKYTAAGGTISMRITEKTVKKSGYATYEFCVKDNGMGMEKEFLDTMFDPFTRVKSSTVSGIQGTGLGMAITKNIIDMMGGKIDVKSEIGKGTEITVTFDFKLKNAPREVLTIPEFTGVKGLVADDDSNTCLSIAKMLKDIGMRSEWCTSGKEAVIRAEAAYRDGDLFKVYIIDWLMPDMNGIETTRRIRKVIGDDVPIIILTAYDWSDIEDEAREAGVTDFVSKPMFPSDLHRVLTKCIGKEEKAPQKEEKEFDLSGKKILLVEDNELNREIATAVLEEYGCEVFPAEDGDIAVGIMEAAKAGDYDLVLMDVQMPTIDGYEATRQIRALGTEISKIPILAMTANAFEEDRQAAFKAGMDDHIAKPIDIEMLKETLAKFL